MSVPLTPSADKNWITARWACLEESMARSLIVISLLFQSTTHCRYRVYTKFLLTFTAISRRNRKVPPLGITALQPQSHFHLGTPYKWVSNKMQQLAVFAPIIRSTPDDGCKEHPKRVERSCSEIKYRLLTAAFCWKLIYIIAFYDNPLSSYPMLHADRRTNRHD
jgi:hypothetical protein